MTPPLIPITQPDRAAPDVVKGFLYQVVQGAIRWLELAEGELLLCEGDEDLVKALVTEDGVALKELNSEQLKAIDGRISARSPQVYSTIFGFMVAFHFHRESGNAHRQRFMFTTSASRAKQQRRQGKEGEVKIDVLQQWEQLPARGTVDRKQLIESLEQLTHFYNKESEWEVGDKRPKGSISSEKINAAQAFLKGTPDAWDEFLEAVDWNLSTESARELQGRLERLIREDERTKRLPEKLLAQRLIADVFFASASQSISRRHLSPDTLMSYVSMTRNELEQWSESVHPERLDVWRHHIEERVTSVEHRVTSLESLVGKDIVIDPEILQDYRRKVIAANSSLSVLGGSGIGVGESWRLQAKWEEDREECSFEAARVFESDHHIILLHASGGGGKTTLVGELAHTLALSGEVPGLVQLRGIARGMAEGETFVIALQKYVAGLTGLNHAVSALLLENMTHLIFDGLDECGSNAHGILEAIKEYSDFRQDLCVLVTVRSGVAVESSFRRARLLELSEHEVLDFAESIAENVVGVELADKAVAGFSALKRRASLSNTPLAITMLLLVASQAATVTTKSELYKRFFEALRTRPLPGGRTVKQIEVSVAYRGLQLLGWLLTSRGPLSLPDLIEAASATDAESEIETVIQFWTARGALRKTLLRGVEEVEFTHPTLCEYAAGAYLGHLSSESCQALLMKSAINEIRPAVLFAAEQNPGVVQYLLEILSETDDHEEVILLANSAHRLEGADTVAIEKIAVLSEEHLISSIPSHCKAVLEAILPLVPKAPSAFGSVANRIENRGQEWSSLAALAIRLAAGKSYIDSDKLQMQTARLLRSEPVEEGAKRNSTVEWRIYNELVPDMLDMLVREKPGETTKGFVESFVLNADAPININALQLITMRLEEWGYSDIGERRAAKSREYFPHDWGIRAKKSYQADLAFLHLLSEVVPEQESSEQVGLAPLARLLGVLNYGEALAGCWNPQVLASEFAFGEVMRGLIQVLGIDKVELGESIAFALKLVPSEIEEDSTYWGLWTSSFRSPATPAWERTPADLDLSLLVPALARRTPIGQIASHLILHHSNRTEVGTRLLAVALSRPNYRVVQLLAGLAKECWPDSASEHLVRILSEKLCDTTAPLLKTLHSLSRDLGEFNKLVGVGLSSKSGALVSATCEVLGHINGFSPPDELKNLAVPLLQLWTTWATDPDSPLEHREYGAVEDGTTLYGKRVAAELLTLAINFGAISSSTIEALLQHSFLQTLASAELVKRASREELKELIRRVGNRTLPVAVLNEVFLLEQKALKWESDMLLDLHSHVDEKIRHAVVSSIRKGGWLTPKHREEILKMHLEDDDTNIRNIAANGLSGVESTRAEELSEILGR